MKVAALTPHFVIESSPTAEAAEAKRTASKLHLKVVKPEKPSAPNESGQALDQETREGLKRLAALISEQKKKKAQDEAVKAAKELSDRRRAKIFTLYRKLQENHDPAAELGKVIDTFV